MRDNMRDAGDVVLAESLALVLAGRNAARPRRSARQGRGRRRPRCATSRSWKRSNARRGAEARRRGRLGSHHRSGRAPRRDEQAHRSHPRGGEADGPLIAMAPSRQGDASLEGQWRASGRHRGRAAGSRTPSTWAVLDEGRWTGYQKLLIGGTAFAVILDGMDNQLLGNVIPALMREWSLPRSAFTTVVAVGPFGMMIGGALGGMLGDRIGRRIALLASVLAFALPTLAIATVDGLVMLGVLRFVAGLGLGGAMPNAAALASEYVPTRQRPFAVTLTIVCIPLGGTLAALLAGRILPQYGWRALFVAGGVIPLMRRRRVVQAAARVAAVPGDAPRTVAGAHRATAPVRARRRIRIRVRRARRRRRRTSARADRCANCSHRCCVATRWGYVARSFSACSPSTSASAGSWRC